MCPSLRVLTTKSKRARRQTVAAGPLGRDGRLKIVIYSRARRRRKTSYVDLEQAVDAGGIRTLNLVNLPTDTLPHLTSIPRLPAALADNFLVSAARSEASRINVQRQLMAGLHGRYIIERRATPLLNLSKRDKSAQSRASAQSWKSSNFRVIGISFVRDTTLATLSVSCL